MITFKKIAFKNFLSTGNKLQEIELDNDKFTIVIGPNGAGKTTFVSAIYYAIYGRTFSTANLSSLINNINQKNCLVELDFEVDGTEYRIRRGQKPAILEIYRNGKLVPQMPNTKDYQAWLINSVIKIPEKTFRQIIILGSTQYIPFMKLAISERRTVIESILNLDAFPIMQTIAKERLDYSNGMISTHNMCIRDSETDIQNIKNRLEDLDKQSDIIDDAVEKVKEIKEKIKNIISAAEYQKLKVDNLKQFLIERTSISLADLQTKINAHNKKIQQLHFEIKTEEKNQTHFDNDVCPYCEQEIDSNYAALRKFDITNIIATKKCEIDKLSNEVQEWAEEATSIEDIIADIKVAEKEYNNFLKELQHQKDLYTIATQHKKKVTETNASLEQSLKEELKGAKMQKDFYEEDLHKEEWINKNKRSVLDLFKDTGLKSLIIRKYLPIINSLMRKYLDIVGFNGSIIFDESFNSTIKMRNRIETSYMAFSSGERFRVDLATLAMLRELSSLRNSINCNLIVSDEVGDAILDNDGTEAMISLLKSSPQKIILITHQPESYTTVADRIINVKKENNFSKYTIS